MPKLTHKTACLRAINKNIRILGKYEDRNKEIPVKCEICDEKYLDTYERFIGRGCLHCGSKIIPYEQDESEITKIAGISTAIVENGKLNNNCFKCDHCGSQVRKSILEIQTSGGCDECMLDRDMYIEKCQLLAKVRDIHFFFDYTADSCVWVCNKKHVIQKSLFYMKRENICYDCSSPWISYDSKYNEGSSCNIQIISDEEQYVGSESMYYTSCAFGHMNKQTYREAVHFNPSWCNDCMETRKGTVLPVGVLTLARIKNGKFAHFDPEVLFDDSGNNGTISYYYGPAFRAISCPFLWTCDKNHMFTRTIFEICKLGKWCDDCEFGFNGDREELEKLIGDKNGKLISRDYRGVSTRYTIKCKNNHLFRISFGNIREGHFCLECSIAEVIGDRGIIGTLSHCTKRSFSCGKNEEMKDSERKTNIHKML